MNIATVKTVITRFLTSETSEVLALKGAWGTGKTYLWKQLVKQNKDKIALENYCYVSLFGVSSITELRTTIFAKTKPVKHLDEENGSIKSLFQNFKDLPYIKHISIGIEALASYMIRDTIICLDDFERMSATIKSDELLGLISELKEEKGCKVALIFNESKLKGPNQYKKSRGKVIDYELLFAPTSEEAIELAIPTNLPHFTIIKKYVTTLGMNNMRALQKIVSFIKLIHNEISNLHIAVIEQAIMTLVFFVWCSYDPDERKPTPGFIIEWNRASWSINESNDNEADPKKIGWVKILEDYGLMHIDEFGQAIFKVIEHGYLEETGFSDEAKRLDAQFRDGELEQSFSVSWGLFHNTFADNEAELINAMTINFRKAVRHISPLNLNGTVVLFRQLGKNEEADELITYYIENRADENKLFDLSENIFSRDVTDPVIRERFERQYSGSHSILSLEDTIKDAVFGHGFSQKHIETLRCATEDDFYKFFKLEHGDSLGKFVWSCLSFEESTEHKSIGQKVRSALIRIGKENQLNAIRVKRFGILVQS